MKSFFLTSMILILAPTLIFLPVYALLIYTSVTNVKDYSADIQGQWNAYQYYYENKLIGCNSDVWMSVTIDDKSITVDGTVLPQAESDYTWINGTSLKYEANGETFTFLLTFDSNNNLKIVVEGTPYIIMLRKSEG